MVGGFRPCTIPLCRAESASPLCKLAFATCRGATADDDGDWPAE